MPPPSKTHRIGVILAAGRGGRMGRTKQLVTIATPEGKKSLVAAAYDAIRAICNDIVVVLGHDREAVVAALADRPFHHADSNPDAPMFESIRSGIAAAREIDSTATIIVQPGDHPMVTPLTLSLLAASSLDRPAQAIIPEYHGRGGHPVLMPPAVAAYVLHAECPGGLGQFWRAHPDLAHRLAVDDPSVLRDIDTPADLAP